MQMSVHPPVICRRFGQIHWPSTTSGYELRRSKDFFRVRETTCSGVGRGGWFGSRQESGKDTGTYLHEHVLFEGQQHSDVLDDTLLRHLHFATCSLDIGWVLLRKHMQGHNLSLHWNGNAKFGTKFSWIAIFILYKSDNNFIEPSTNFNKSI